VSFGSDPFFGSAVGYNPQSASNLYNYAALASQNAYQQGMQQYQQEQLAFQQAQQAYTDAMSMGSAYGYMPQGNLFSWPIGGQPSFSMPMPGQTPLAAQQQALTQIGTLQQNQLASSQATGLYSAPMALPYQPGTLLKDPNGFVGVVNQDGSLTGFSNPQQLAQFAASRGTTADALLQYAVPASSQQMQQLQMGPPTQLPQTTLAAQQQAAQQAAQQAGITGMYTQPGTGNIALDAWNSQASQDQKQTYLNAEGGNVANASNRWWQDMQGAIAQSGQTPQQYAYGAGNETLAAQQQYATQANQLSQMYGQYYAPTAPGQTAQAGVNAPTPGQATQAAQQQAWQQQYQTAQFGLQAQGQQQQAAQQYLQLLSQLQGPADYGQYLRTLASAPQGLTSLVGAAAGNYIPGGGTTGVAPQAQTLQNLVGAATGFAGGGTGANAPSQSGTQDTSGQGATGSTGASQGGMNYQNYLATAQGLPAPNQLAPQSYNAMTPSERQMLGGMWSNLGWSPQDISSLYQTSLPKYAAGSAAGSMRLV
jgi:hypothetical protein